MSDPREFLMWLDANARKALHKVLSALRRGRLELGATDLVELDEVDVRQCALAEVAQRVELLCPCR